ncbi:MAG: hypothetical protein JO227_08535 [Acetobacteraceae bacterium]|nr:hypothetical protein [Acetobacteraceae bacterium]
MSALAALCARTAMAVPAFAQQTGQPCSACHIGSFGPQLTPLGRAFKIGGYTQTGGEGLAAKIPLSAMILGSFTNTGTPQPSPPADHFGRNNNFALDQISVFLAGRVNDYAGGFVQGTYSGTNPSVKLDNTDLRLTTPLSLGEHELRIGLSANNAPTVQDAFNSTFIWMFPFASSALAPVPSAQTLLAGGLAGNAIGMTAYAWYDRRLYLEAGGYQTYGPSLLRATGTALGPGATAGIAPYVRAAYEWDWAGQSAHVGALLLSANLNPAISALSSDSSLGQNHFSDYEVDAGYQFLGTGRHIVTAYGSFTHENQDLRASFNAGSSSQTANTLNQLRSNLSYFFENTYGLTVGWQSTWGSANPLLFPPAPVSGSRNGKPDSDGFVVEADWIPFGKEKSWARPFVNMKLGVQYIAYTRFNGGTQNYDGFGRNASDNNTLFAYLWMMF